MTRIKKSYWKPYLRGVVLLVGVGRGSAVPAVGAVVVVSLSGPDVDGKRVLFSPLDILQFEMLRISFTTITKVEMRFLCGC